MSMRESVVQETTKQLNLFILTDVSGSMEGTKITTVNETCAELIPEIKDVGTKESITIKQNVMSFSDAPQWMYPEPVDVEDFEWKKLVADGWTSMGSAFRELDDKLSKEKFLKSKSACAVPVIFLMSDGQPTDEYKTALEALWQKNWFKHAIKVAIAIGNDANQDVLAEFTGDPKAVITTHTPEALREWIKIVTMCSTQIGSKSYTHGGMVKDKNEELIEQIQIAQEDPDLAQLSTIADEWE